VIGGERLAILSPPNPDPSAIIVAEAPYSDNPHLKRREFYEAVGPYAEGVPMTKMELAMARAVAAQARFSVATIDGLDVFRHIGGRFSFNPGVRRDKWLARVEAVPGGRALIGVARRFARRLRRKP